MCVWFGLGPYGVTQHLQPSTVAAARTARLRCFLAEFMLVVATIGSLPLISLDGHTRAHPFFPKRISATPVSFFDLKVHQEADFDCHICQCQMANRQGEGLCVGQGPGCRQVGNWRSEHHFAHTYLQAKQAVSQIKSSTHALTSGVVFWQGKKPGEPGGGISATKYALASSWLGLLFFPLEAR